MYSRCAPAFRASQQLSSQLRHEASGHKSDAEDCTATALLAPLLLLGVGAEEDAARLVDSAEPSDGGSEVHVSSHIVGLYVADLVCYDCL